MAVTFVDQQPGCGPPAPVPILQWEKEFQTLLAVYRLCEPQRTLEVGTYHGGTLYHWLQNSNYDTQIVSVDSYAVGVDNRHLYDEWAFGKGLKPIAIKGDSHDPTVVDEVASYGPFGWIAIDAGHYYHEVKRDWELYRPLAAEGGVVCFHDILTHPSWPSIEVGQLWAEIKKDHLTFEIVADRDAPWGGWGCVMVT